MCQGWRTCRGRWLRPRHCGGSVACRLASTDRTNDWSALMQIQNILAAEGDVAEIIEH